jgi:hypothetical protein
MVQLVSVLGEKQQSSSVVIGARRLLSRRTPGARQVKSADVAMPFAWLEPRVIQPMLFGCAGNWKLAKTLNREMNLPLDDYAEKSSRQLWLSRNQFLVPVNWSGQ